MGAWDTVGRDKGGAIGCMGSAIIFVALAVLLTSATGNLFFLTLILISLLLVALSRAVR